MFTPSKCKLCGAAIIWAVTKNGKRVPLDFDPVERGGAFILFVDLGSTKVEAIRPRDFQPALLPLFRERYVTHFVTCPEIER